MKAKQVIYVALIWLIGQYALAGSPRHRNLRDVDFENYTYRYADQEFRVEDGRYESADDETSLESLDVISVKFGHLTQTANEEAAVLTRYNGGGTGVFDAIHIFKLEKGRPTLIDVIEGGDRANGGIKTFNIENGSLYIINYDGEMNPCNTCEDYERTTEYKWKGQEFAAIWKSEPRAISGPELEGDAEADEEILEENEGATVDVARASAEGAAEDPLADLLNSSQNNARSKAIAILSETKDPQYVGLILNALSDSSELVKRTAILGLAQMGEKQAVDPLIQTLKDKSWDIRTDAVWALGELGDRRAAGPIMQLYREAIAAGQPRAGDEAIEALGKFKAGQSMPVLLSALEDPNPDRRAAAAWALGELGDAEAVPALTAVLKTETRPYIRPDIQSALQKLAMK